MSDRKEAAYQIIQAANKAGVALNEVNFNCFTDLSGGNIKNLWPKLTDQECDELSEMFPSSPKQPNGEMTYRPKNKVKRVFNVSAKNSARSTHVQIDLNNGTQHSITIEYGSNAQLVANALRALADEIAPKT